MHRRLSKVFLSIPIVIFFFIFISCATEAVKEEEKVTPTEATESKEGKEETKTAEEATAETKVPKATEEETTRTTTTEEKQRETVSSEEQPKATRVEQMTSAERRLQSDERAFTSIDVYFDFDKYNLKPKAREILADKAYWLKKNPSVKIYIEGHCDERGTNEYNLALGERRANSAKMYLTSLGISPGRLGTISYGEERPIDPSRNEVAWAKNRRAHFVITSR